MNPRYPIYVISKGRWGSRLTSKVLELMNVPYHIVVEPQEYDRYAEVIDPNKIYTLPFANLGQGSIPARNWYWEHSIKQGAKWHWMLDDNIRDFYRLNRNRKIRVKTGITFKIIEDFADRYKNLAQAGMQYMMFAIRKRSYNKPYILNTRIYSYMLIRNEIPFRWRGRYNEDTDLSIRCLKAGWCTILFYAFLANKQATMLMKGGNTESLYKGDGRLLMAQSLYKQHPDIVRIKRKWGRWQHYVNYNGFKHNKLMLEDGVTLPNKPNEYGMKIVKVK